MLKSTIIGQRVNVVIDRPLGSRHPEHKTMIYKVNYGYIPTVTANDGEMQDCYVLGVKEPIESFDGIVVAIIHRKNDVEDKWVVVKEGVFLTDEEILSETYFQEQYFDIQLIK